LKFRLKQLPVLTRHAGSRLFPLEQSDGLLRFSLKQLALFGNCCRSTQFAFAQRAQIEPVSLTPSMIVTDWSDAALTIANDGGNVIAERASAPYARAPTQAE
jgi:hypothetical protein